MLAKTGSAQTALSLAIRGGMQASMVGTYMQSAILPTSSATNSGRELGVGNESGLANNIAANDLYACTTCPDMLGGPLRKGDKAIKLGKYLLNDRAWHSVKKTFLSRIGKGKYEKIVGNNPDIDFKGLKIVLKASKNSPYVGKTYETSFTVIEFIEFLFELGVK